VASFTSPDRHAMPFNEVARRALGAHLELTRSLRGLSLYRADHGKGERSAFVRQLREQRNSRIGASVYWLVDRREAKRGRLAIAPPSERIDWRNLLHFRKRVAEAPGLNSSC
jgi:hypothetical protein